MKGIGGRRFILCIGVGITNTVLLVLHHIDPGTYAEVIIGTIGGYIAGDYLQNRHPRPGPTYNGQVDDPDMR
jgi:hypothetical protein